jgi:hypothetical protein
MKEPKTQEEYLALWEARENWNKYRIFRSEILPYFLWWLDNEASPEEKERYSEEQVKKNLERLDRFMESLKHED